jgi:hypothetical protein
MLRATVIAVVAAATALIGAGLSSAAPLDAPHPTPQVCSPFHSPCAS